MATKIDLSSIYTCEDKYTVLQLLKKLIEVVEDTDVGQPLYRHTLYCDLGKLSFVTDDPMPYTIVYENNKWFVKHDGQSRGRLDWLVRSALSVYFVPSGEIAKYSVATVADQESNGQFYLSYYEDASNLVTEPLMSDSTDYITDIVSKTLF